MWSIRRRSSLGKGPATGAARLVVGSGSTAVERFEDWQWLRIAVVHLVEAPGRLNTRQVPDDVGTQNLARTVLFLIETAVSWEISPLWIA